MRTARPVLTSLAATTTLLLGAAGAHAGGVDSTDGSGTRVANLLYTLDAASPTTGDPCNPESDDVPQETATLRVSADGEYAIHDARAFDNDGQISIFDPATGEPGCQIADDGQTVELSAGVEYRLTLTDFFQSPEFEPGESDTFGFTVTGVNGTTGTVTFDEVVDTDSPVVVGGSEVTGNGSNLAVIDYTTDAGSPTATDFPASNARPCDANGTLPGETPYEVARLQVSADGDYRFRSVFTDPDFGSERYLAIHEGEVATPDGPGCIETTDLTESVPLETGVTYTVFLSAVEDLENGDEAAVLGRHLISVTPDEEFDGRVTFLPAEVEIDEAVVCAPGGEVPAGYTVLEGTSRNDTLTGTSGNDVIRGLGGNDTLRGLGGDDILCGGAGNDSLEGGAGEDVLFGGAGNDSSSGGADDDVLVDAGGNDRLDGGAGSDVGFDRVGNNTFLRVESRELPDGIVAR